MKRKAIVIGATGLVGTHLVNQLGLMYERLIIIARQPPATMCAKMEFYQVADFGNLAPVITGMNLDSNTDAFTCLGSTKRQAGSDMAFRKIDYHYNLNFATLCHTQGVGQFFLLSAHGADKDSRFFYNQVKGELEQAVAALNFKQLLIFRPSLLLGHHKGRPLETIIQTAYKVIAPLVPKNLSTRPIAAERVAAAMALTAQNLYERQKFAAHDYDMAGLKPGEQPAGQVTIIDNKQLLAMTRLTA